MKHFLVALFLFSSALTAKEVQVATHEVGSLQFELTEAGILTVGGPQFSAPLKIGYGNKFLQMAVIHGRVFVSDEHGFTYLVVLPGSEGFLARQITRFLNSGAGEKLIRGRWAESYRWDLFGLNNDMEIQGKVRHVIASRIHQSDDGFDIILQTYESNFSLRRLLEELDRNHSESPALCAIFLKAYDH